MGLGGIRKSGNIYLKELLVQAAWVSLRLPSCGDPLHMRGRRNPHAKPQVKEARMTLAEKWMAEGEAKGKAETLRKQLTVKFGTLSETAVSRLAAATEADVERWLELVLTADTLEVLLDLNQVRTKEKAEIMRKVLTLKFGQLSELALLRLGNANEADLDRWLERFLTADTLDAVLNA